MVKGAKVATTYRKVKKVAPAGLPRVGGGGNAGVMREREGFVGGASGLDGAGSKAGSDEPGFSVVGIGKLLSLHSGAQSQAKDRGIAPPALPVPIASFTI